MPVLTSPELELTTAERTALLEALTRRKIVIGGGAFAALAGQSRSFAQSIQATPRGGWSFTDDRGATVTLPQRPARVVADMMVASALWDLGYRVSGVWNSAGYLASPLWSELSSYTGENVVDITVDGSYTPDIEKVVELDPDVIAGIVYFDDTFYFIAEGDQPKLDRVAPSIGLSNGGVSVASLAARVEELAVVLGADVTLPEIVARKERFAAAEEALRMLAAERSDLKVLFVYGDIDQVYIANPNAWGDLRYFSELGLDIVKTRENDATDYYWEIISWELLASYPADLIMVGNEEAPYPFADNPVWQQLPAVEAGQVGVWGTNAPPSYQATAYLLETLTKAVRDAKVIN